MKEAAAMAASLLFPRASGSNAGRNAALVVTPVVRCDHNRCGRRLTVAVAIELQ